VAVLRKHQRCFPVEQDGELLPVFIAVRNGGEAHLDEVAKGTEAVVRARFADAAFFVDKDRRTKLEDFVPQLAALTFQQKLGSMLDKTERLEALVAGLAKLLPVDQDELKTAQRAARLAKADLATNMVVEMTSLQGVMGAKYALDAGEPPEVAEAIREHYLPASAGDRAPHTKAGLLLGIADRLDSLAGLFAAGLAPTGSKDPFALRRAALGLIHNLIAWELDFDLRAGLEAAAHRLPIEANAAHIDEALAFIVGRLRVHLTEAGHAYDAVDALLAAQGRNPHGAAKAVEVLVEFTKRDDWTHILDTYARCVRITRGQTLPERVDGKALVEDAERALLKALEAAEQVKRAPGSVDDFFAVFLPLMPAIERFFDDVLVMAEDDKLRAARLGLLGRIAALAEGVAHLEKLEGF
jgi:glycyl-tRNA synthetase